MSNSPSVQLRGLEAGSSDVNLSFIRTVALPIMPVPSARVVQGFNGRGTGIWRALEAEGRRQAAGILSRGIPLRSKILR